MRKKLTLMNYNNMFGRGTIQKIGNRRYILTWQCSQLRANGKLLSVPECTEFDCFERASVRIDEIVRLARWKASRGQLPFTLQG